MRQVLAPGSGGKSEVDPRAPLGQLRVLMNKGVDHPKSPTTQRAWLVGAGIVFGVVLGFILGRMVAGPTSSSETSPEKPTLREASPPTLSGLPDLTGREILFADLLKKTFGRQIIRFDPEKSGHAAIRRALTAAAEDCRVHFSGPDSPISKFRRINEASRLFEDRLQFLLDAHPDFTCEAPRNAEGNLQRSGYPDLRLLHLPSGTVAYLDPKLFEETSAESSFRTFYYEPQRGTGKITEDALHLLLGFAHDGESGAWTFTQWHLADLSRLEVSLKAEFSASNRDLYQPELLIAP